MNANAIPDLIDAFNIYTVNMTWPKFFLSFSFLSTCCTRLYRKNMTRQKHVCTNYHTLIEVQCSHFTDKKIKAERESQN